MAVARACAAGAVLVLALASGIRDLPDTGGWLIDQRRGFERWGPREHNAIAAEAHGLPIDAFEFFRARATRGRRYFVDAAPSESQPGVDRAQAVRIFARTTSCRRSRSRPDQLARRLLPHGARLRQRDGLATFSDPDGTSAVEAVERVATTIGHGARAGDLPDLIVHWSDHPTVELAGVGSPRFGDVARGGVGTGWPGNHCDDAWALHLPRRAALRTPEQPPRVVDLAATACHVLGIDTAGLAGQSLLEPP